ncbi:MAG: alpha/beta hydrolase [Chloroflexota bacterium]
MIIKSDFARLKDITLHFAQAGQGYPIIFLHGFPAFWYVWRTQLEQLSQTMWVIAPDGRGVNQSSKPSKISDYHINKLAQDVIQLADYLEVERFVLVGHDWGGAQAWQVAQQYPDRVSHLIVANAPPLSALHFALATMPEQKDASAYMYRLKAHTAESTLLANRCERLWQVSFERLMAAGIFSDHDKAKYLNCWETPGSLTGFLNWYRANISEFDQIDAERHKPNAENQVHTKTLLLWGEHERAFIRPLLKIIPKYAPNVQIVDVPNASHWIHLENPSLFHYLIFKFISQ